MSHRSGRLDRQSVVRQEASWIGFPFAFRTCIAGAVDSQETVVGLLAKLVVAEMALLAGRD